MYSHVYNTYSTERTFNLNYTSYIGTSRYQYKGSNSSSSSFALVLIAVK